MKRSQVNEAVTRAMDTLDASGIRLPAFGYWTMAEWLSRAGSTADLRAIGLGWDVTDFGSGCFDRTGSVLFTLRNGSPSNPAAGTPYAEKLIVQRHETEQEIPFHFHRAKTEDIINRGGGTLSVQLYNATPEGRLDVDGEIRARFDGVWRTLPAGSVVDIERGCSVTMHPGLYHRFWAKRGAGDLVVGEVSSVNDDVADNFFLDSHRFASIEEDVAPLVPLCNEYARLLGECC